MKRIVIGCALLALAVSGSWISRRARATTPSQPVATATQECSAVYAGRPVPCVRVACDAEYRQYLGTWNGEFHAYERKQSTPGHSVYRPYDESVSYVAGDCLRNTSNGDVFIVGHQTDRYPAFGELPEKVEKSLLITGRHADGTPYLRTVGSEGSYDYRLVFRDAAAVLSIWRLRMPAAHGQPAMTFTIVDGRDFNAASAHRRNVTISMQVGPDKTPYWQGVIAYGWHARRG